MYAAELYDEIKEALKFFGLRFSEMDKMSVKFLAGAVVFEHEGRSIKITTP